MKTIFASFILIGLMMYGGEMTGQEYYRLMNLVKAKYYEREVTCGKISVQEVKPDEVVLYTKLVYSDNRNGQDRIIILPEIQRTYVYNGDSTLVIFDKSHSYSVYTDTFALLRFTEFVDNISALLLTRQKIVSAADSQNIAESKETILDIDQNHKRVILEFGDNPDYFTKDISIANDFNIEMKELKRTLFTYTFIDQNLSNEHILDTVYSNEQELDKVWKEIESKLTSYEQVILEITEEEELELNVDFKAVLDRLTFLTDLPKESDYYLFDFYYIQCPPCLKSVSYIKKLREMFPQEKLTIIGINAYDSKEKINEYLKKTNITYSSAMIDISYIKESIGQIPYPTFVLFDQTGKKLWYYSGFDEQLVENVSRFIKKE